MTAIRKTVIHKLKTIFVDISEVFDVSLNLLIYLYLTFFVHIPTIVPLIKHQTQKNDDDNTVIRSVDVNWQNSFKFYCGIRYCYVTKNAVNYKGANDHKQKVKSFIIRDVSKGGTLPKQATIWSLLYRVVYMHIYRFSEKGCTYFQSILVFV